MDYPGFREVRSDFSLEECGDWKFAKLPNFSRQNWDTPA